MLFLLKEASNKDVNLKTQMMIAIKEDKGENSTERNWKENGFFKDQRTNLTIGKPNFPENTHVYINNSSISPLKGGHAMYHELVISAQILPMANPPPGIDLNKRGYKDHEVLIYTPLYNTENGLYRGLTKKLGYVTLRGDVNEIFTAMAMTNKTKKSCFVLPNNQCPIFFSAQLSKNIQPF